MKKPGVAAGLRLHRLNFGLPGAKAEVQASAHKSELAALITAVGLPDCLTPIGYANDVIAVSIIADVDVEAFDLRADVVGEGVLDTAADRPTNIVALVTSHIGDPLRTSRSSRA